MRVRRRSGPAWPRSSSLGGVCLGWLVAACLALTPAAAQDVQNVIRLLDSLLAPPPPPPQQYERQQPVRPTQRRPSTLRAEGPAVAEVQEMLNALGYDAGPADGVAGQRTLSAAAQFRSAYGLDPAGGIDQALVAALKVAVRQGNVHPGQPAPPEQTFGQGTGQPSFSCGAARKPTERTICASPDLAAMDREVADLYTKARAAANPAQREALRADQTRWIGNRNACRANATCIETRMKERKIALTQRGRGAQPSGPTVADSGWTTKRTSFPAQAARPITFDAPGIRAVEPVLVEGRLLTGFPVMMGDLKGPPVRMRYREVPSTEMALALYLDLAVVKQWPQILDDPKSAYYLAERFLTGDLADRYVAGCPAGCGTTLPYPGWTGSNEFEREATYLRFRETIVPDLAAKAPAFPIGVTHVIEMELGAYDRARQVFPLRLNRPGPNWDALFGSMGGARRLQVEQDYKLPEELPFPADQAQALFGRLKQGTRFAYLSLDQRLDEPGWHIDRNDPKAKLVVERVRLFADAGLTDQIHEYVEEDRAVVAAPQGDKAQAGPLKVEYWRDTVLIGGRVAAVIGGLPTNMEDKPEGLNIDRNPIRLVRDYGLADDPSWFDNDTSALGLIFQLDAPVRDEIIEEAIQRPLAESEKSMLRLSNGYPGEPIAGDPFVERRAIEALRKRADRVVPKDLPPQPIPLRVYCFVDLGRYDFDTQSFPVTANGCDSRIDGVAGLGGMGQAAEAPGEMPDRLALPPDEAERFSAMIEGSNRVTVSFETDLTIKTARSEAGHRRVATLSPRSHFWVHPPKRMTETLYRLDRPAPEPQPNPVGEAIAGDPGRIWNLGTQDQRAALMEFAQGMGSLPYDGRAMLAAAEGHYGTVVGRGAPFNPTPEDPGTAGPFFGSPHVDFIPMLANALGVPREHLITMAYVQENEPISGIVALLPAPYDTFMRTARPDSYGQTQLIFETSMEIAGIHRFDLPFANPLIVLSARPTSARFTTSNFDKPKTLETFDLTTPISFPDYEVLAVPPRIPSVVAAAEALGSKVEDVVRNTMDWPDGLDVFQRQDIVMKLVESGKTGKAEDTLWVTGELKMGEYDFSTQSFPPMSVSLGHIEMMRLLDLPASSIGFTMADLSPFTIKMAPEEARIWAQSYPRYTTIPLRARLRLFEPSLQQRSIGFKAELLEAELLEKGSVAAVRDPERVLYRYPIGTAENAQAPVGDVAAADTQETDEPDHEPIGRDILGIQLGEALEGAVVKVGEELGPSETYFATRDARMEQGGITRWESYSSATLLHEPNEQVMIALYSEPPAAESVVTGIARSQVFQRGEGPHPDQLLARLKEKYGEPGQGSKSAQGLYLWQSPGVAKPCGVTGALAGYSVNLSLSRMARESGQKTMNEPAWVDSSGQRWLPPATEPFDLRKVFASLADCDDDIVIGLLQNGSDGLVAAFYLGLTNPAVVAGHQADNERRFMQISDDGAASPGAPKVKF